MIVRAEPVTAYQIAKLYASPIYNFNTAKGKLYPLIQRLVDQGLVRSLEVPHDRRGTHLYSCTEAGRSALKAWLCVFRPEHELLPDPLRKKLQALDLLTLDEQLEWVDDARAHINTKLQAVNTCAAISDVPFGDLAQDNARESLRGRLRWLDRLEKALRRRAVAQP